MAQPSISSWPRPEPLTRVSYIVSGYQKPEQLIRLLNALAAPETRIHLHIDRRSPRSVHERIGAGTSGIEGIDILPSHRCNWGGFGHVAATLKGMRAAVANRSDWAVLLTGQDYPIKPRGRLNALLGAHRGHGFIDPTALPRAEWSDDGGRGRYSNRHVTLAGRRVRLPGLFLPTPRPRSFYPWMSPYGGSSYWCLHIDLVRYVLDFVSRHPDVVRYFQTVHAPDEMFFHSILGSSPKRGLLTGSNLHHIRWSDNAKSPDILTSADLPALAASPMFFGRKFDTATDTAVLDAIDATLLDAEQRPPS